MLSSRNWIFGLAIAGIAAPAGAQAQQYYQAPQPYYYAQPQVPPPPGFNRVIVTDAPIPPDIGRPYPYTSNAPGYVAPQTYAPGQPHWKRKRAAKPLLSPGKRADQAQLIEELKKRPRIKKVTIDTSAAPLPPAGAPGRGKPAMFEKDGGRVIRAEAEVRIMGNDQMSIRLYRRGTAPRAQAE